MNSEIFEGGSLGSKEKVVNRITLGQFINRRRKRLSLTQEQLADRLNVSKSAVAKWETDGGIPDRDNLYRLAEILGVTVDDLHHVIDISKSEDKDLEINITADVIAALESYGYKVIRPGEKEGKR